MSSYKDYNKLNATFVLHTSPPCLKSYYLLTLFISFTMNLFNFIYNGAFIKTF